MEPRRIWPLAWHRVVAWLLVGYAAALVLGTAAEWGHWLRILRWPLYR